MDYNDNKTELKYYYPSLENASFGKIKAAFVTTEKELLVFHIHENDVYTLTNMKTKEVWSNLKI